jgi:ribonucleoside-diphosphate reductase alpha chain
MLKVVEPEFESYLVDKGMYSKELLNEVVKNGGSLTGLDVPEDMKRAFPVANDIPYPYHVEMQAAFQEYVENSISKSVNLPNDASVDDVYDTYVMAYELGCKGVTVYRDGCRSDQVINWESKEEVPPVQGVVAIEGARSRPEATTGYTERVVVGCGRKLFITVNEDDEGLFEVFMNVGKGGGCIASHTEALGRMISLALRNYVEPDEIVEQLAGIRCPYLQWNKGGTPFTSCADAVAKVIAKYSQSEDAQGIIKELRLYSNSPECPECGSVLVYQEGCSHCSVCGYTMC